MITNTKRTLLVMLVASLLASCSKNPTDLLHAAKAQLDQSNYLSYTANAYYPQPDSEIVDTIIYKIQFLLDEEDSLGYNYVQQDIRSDIIYQSNMLQVASHKKSTLRTYLPKHFDNRDQFKETVTGKLRYRWSPMNLLKQDWKYVGDTVIENSTFRDYFRIESDRIYEGHSILTEQHIFIGSDALLARFERMNYYDGRLNQRVAIDFSDYNLSSEPIAINYDLPENYISAYGPETELESLKEGERAPDFLGVSMEGDSIDSKMLRGKKILLDFSVTTCGYCKMALNYINQEDYDFVDELSVLYINPEEGGARMEKYMNSTPIPFPVVVNAESIAEQYRVNSYPRFFLIDEHGVIEKIQVGFSKEFLDGLRM